MNKFANNFHQKVYFDKLQFLLSSETYNDITFNCKDGKATGNRLNLAIFSNFLTDIFKENPLLMEHPIYGHPDSGINLPEVYAKDVECLLQVLNSTAPLEVKKEHLKGLQHVAKQLRIELIMNKVTDIVFSIQAVPKAVEDAKPLPKVKKDKRESRSSHLESRENLNTQISKLRTNNNNNSSLLSVVKTELVKTEFDEDIDESMDFGDSEVHDNVCPICKITCKTATGLKIHIGHSHRDNEEIEADDDEKRKPICKCGKIFSFSARKLFREHREKCPAYRKEAFICEICKSPFLSMPSLSIHLTAIHGITKEQRQCLCGVTFGSSYSYRKHAVCCEAYKSAAIFCEFCNLPFLTNGHLTQHLHSSHRTLMKKH